MKYGLIILILFLVKITNGLNYEVFIDGYKNIGNNTYEIARPGPQIKNNNYKSFETAAQIYSNYSTVDIVILWFVETENPCSNGTFMDEIFEDKFNEKKFPFPNGIYYSFLTPHLQINTTQKVSFCDSSYECMKQIICFMYEPDTCDDYLVPFIVPI